MRRARPLFSLRPRLASPSLASRTASSPSSVQLRASGFIVRRANATAATPEGGEDARVSSGPSPPGVPQTPPTMEGSPSENEERPPMTPYAYKQETTWRKDPILPFIDERTRSPLYNPVVDDWVDFNNPRWKALQRTFHRPGPFFIGKCLSIKNAKTAMIEVPYWIRKMKYGKHMAIRRISRFMAHDEDQICEPGDVVEIRQSKKWSKRKHTVVTRILKKDPGNAFIQEHPEFEIVRSRADLRRRIEDLREEELISAGIAGPKKGAKSS